MRSWHVVLPDQARLHARGYSVSERLGRLPIAFRATSGVIRYGPSVLSRQACRIISVSPPVRTNDSAPKNTPIEVLIALAGRNITFPTLTPTATPAFSIVVSSACNKEGAVPTRTRAKVSKADRVPIRLVIELTSEKKFRPYSIDTMGRIPITPDTKIVAAALVV